MSRVGRADLLAVLHRWGKEGLEHAAPCMGFYRRPKKQPLEKPKKEVYAGVSTVPVSEAGLEHRFDEAEPQVNFWWVVAYREKKETETQDAVPDWLDRTKSLVVDEVRADYSGVRPAKIPLLPWSKMWPFLFGVLGYYCDTGSIDIHRAVDLAARAEPVTRLPFRKRLTWAGTCQLILDMDERLLPFWDDEVGLLRGIDKLRGSSGMEVLVFENGPDGLCRRWGKELGELRPYRLPGPGSPILVISDLGCLDTDTNSPTGGRKHAWLRFGKGLQRAGFLPFALMPCPSRLLDTELARYWRLACWDRGERLPCIDEKYRTGVRPHPGLPGDGEAGTERLLGLLSAAIRVEPELLRAVRLLLPYRQADASTEAAVWGHEKVHESPIAFTFDKDAVDHYRDLFKDNPVELKERVTACIKKYHAHLSDAVQAEEDLLAGMLLDKEDKEIEESLGRGFMRRFVKAQREKKIVGQDRPGQWLDRLSSRMPAGVWQGDGVLTAAWLIRNLEAREKGLLTLPPGMDIRKAAWVFGRGYDPVEWVLRRKGGVFFIDRDGWAAAETADGWDDRGSPAAKLTMGSPWLKVSVGDSGDDRDYAINVEARQPVEIPVPLMGQMTLDTDHEQVVMEPLTGLDWATEIGRDGYGLYAYFDINGVVQRMRFIIPGTFMMGSPENEPERYYDEVLHEVVITKGFWLADTACTQALWQAVTGENPSYFKGAQRPVENVSWKDCRDFIDRINGLKPGIDLRLPTEAEWEYACRAGTQTPFWFGDNITPDQVNYDGNYPYADGKKGKYREKTVKVKALPCNSWGLYQMHGNVDEWCADWFGDYPRRSVIDPVGPDDGSNRVLRGGGWIDYGRFVRSAYRFRFEPSFRSFITGLRLVRGSS